MPESVEINENTLKASYCTTYTNYYFRIKSQTIVKTIDSNYTNKTGP